jgi:hypothetical protein
MTRDRFPDVSAELIQRYGELTTSSGAPMSGWLRIGEPPDESNVRPMGPLVELSVERLSDGVVEVWRFRPWPRLVFRAGTKRLWVMGRGFRFDGRGFHATGGLPRGLRRLPIKASRNDPRLRGQRNEFVRTRYGLEPDEAVEGDIELPPKACFKCPAQVIALGYAKQVVYRTDRNDGGSAACEPWNNPDGAAGCALRSGKRDRDGVSAWYHPFEDEGGSKRAGLHTPPLMVTDRTGTGLWFVGGSYSVRNGWLVD